MNLLELGGWYEGLPAFRNLSAESQRNYLRFIRKGTTILRGHTEVKGVRAEEADLLFQTIYDESGKHAAVSCCRIMRRVWNLAVRYRHADFNPFAKMDLPGLDVRQVIWTEDEVWSFYNTCNDLGFKSMGVLGMLCYVFSQRPVDMRLLQWANVKGTTLDFTQQKTGTQVRLFIPDFMMDILKSVRREGSYICVFEETGLPYTERDYNKLLHDVKRKAHLRMELQLRDLRKTGFTEMGDSGATDRELMTAGHLDRGMLDRYVLRSVSQSKSAMNKRFKDRT